MYIAVSSSDAGSVPERNLGLSEVVLKQGVKAPRSNHVPPSSFATIVMASPQKGKGRGDVQGIDAEDQDPVITYRHLLSSGLGVR